MFISNSCLLKQAGVRGTTAEVTCRAEGWLEELSWVRGMGFGWVTCR